MVECCRTVSNSRMLSNVWMVSNGGLLVVEVVVVVEYTICLFKLYEYSPHAVNSLICSYFLSVDIFFSLLADCLNFMDLVVRNKEVLLIFHLCRERA